MAMPLAALAALAALASLEFARRPFVARAERAQAGVRWREPHQRIAAVILGAIALGAVAIPVGTVALEARLGRSAFGDTISVDAIRNGLWWSVVASSIVVIVGVLLGYWRAKATPRIGHVAEMLWVVLFADCHDRGDRHHRHLEPSWDARRHLPDGRYRGHRIRLAISADRCLLCAAFIRRVTTGVEEAAILSGASWLRTVTQIVVPLSSKGLAGVWLVIFILMFGDVSLAILVAPPGESNLGVRAYTLMANSPTSDVAKVALVHIALSMVSMTAMAVMSMRVRHAWE